MRGDGPSSRICFTKLSSAVSTGAFKMSVDRVVRVVQAIVVGVRGRADVSSGSPVSSPGKCTVDGKRTRVLGRELSSSAGASVGLFVSGSEILIRRVCHQFVSMASGRSGRCGGCGQFES